jgi:voltage-gated potassium channel
MPTIFMIRQFKNEVQGLASAKSIKALQTEITGLRTDIQALVKRDIDHN